jgi:hypothetical protein
MFTTQHATRLNRFDLETLRRMRDAEDQGLPSPDASVDELFRLTRGGYVKGDAERLVRVSSVGRKFLAAH